MQIAPLLKIGRGVTALIGGGGKTTLLYTLTEELRRRGTVILCTTTKIRRPEQYETLIAPTEEELCAALAAHGAVCVATISPEGKLSEPNLPIATLASLADYVLIEADGAKMLPLKAHAPYEPVLPKETARVVYIVGADGFGKKIGETCHRPALYAERCGATEEDVVTPERAAKVLLTEGYGDRVYINKVESPEDYENAAALAAQLTCSVVAGSLHKGAFVCLR